MRALTPKEQQKFFAKVNFNGQQTEYVDTPCHEWTASTNYFGYGMFGIDRIMKRAHRVAYMIEHGEDPDGLLIFRKCNNVICVNPEHFNIGSTRDYKERFFEKVNFMGTCTNSVWTRCHEWTGNLEKNGVGKFQLNRKSVWVNRLAYMIEYGEIPDGMFILRQCHNKLCVRADHLYISDNKSRDYKERFFEKVNFNGQQTEYVDTPCHEWTASLTKTGYGQFMFNRKPMKAHRLAYIIKHGEIPNDLWVLHRCNNRICVNPEHLYTGDVQDNVDDMIDADRHARGERNGHAVLTAEQVLEIRAKYETGNYIYRQLGDEYGVHAVTIGLIIRRLNWKHI